MDIEKLNQTLCLRYKVEEGPGTEAMKNWGSCVGPLGAAVSPGIWVVGIFQPIALVLPFLGSDNSHIWEPAIG